MARKRPATITEYIAAAPAAGRPHARRLYRILKRVAPRATETIKWGTPFFVEPRFLFAFSVHKGHLSFAPMAAALAHFHDELAQYDVTKNFLRIPFDQPLPEALVRKIARHCVSRLRGRTGDSFW
jgi:uncharacterized protein YdhG (YjbR/CyaY superfamily)